MVHLVLTDVVLAADQSLCSRLGWVRPCSCWKCLENYSLFIWEDCRGLGVLTYYGAAVDDGTRTIVLYPSSDWSCERDLEE